MSTVTRTEKNVKADGRVGGSPLQLMATTINIIIAISIHSLRDSCYQKGKECDSRCERQRRGRNGVDRFNSYYNNHDTGNTIFSPDANAVTEPQL